MSLIGINEELYLSEESNEDIELIVAYLYKTKC